MAARTLCVAKWGWWWKYCDGGKGRLFKTRQSGVPVKCAWDVGIPGRWCGKPVWEEWNFNRALVGLKGKSISSEKQTQFMAPSVLRLQPESGIIKMETFSIIICYFEKKKLESLHIGFARTSLIHVGVVGSCCFWTKSVTNSFPKSGELNESERWRETNITAAHKSSPTPLRVMF